uniref:BHLH domain-containing protein n=2 Tax=Esox lucius TaxID=8010 RepID=A0A6Q2Z8P7_ESOLU
NMKLEGRQSTKMDRKLLKPQVEKRRRERMNQSLESLRTLLLQRPQHQVVTRRNLEKSEILEQTVLFLQDTGDKDRKKAEGGEQQSPFHDGLSACLQRAVHFLGHEREGLRLEGALNNIFSAGLNSNACVSTKVPAKAYPSSSSPRTLVHQSSRLMTTQESYTRPQLCGVSGNTSHSHRAPLRHGIHNAPQQTCRDTDKEVHSQNLSTSHSVWRPWP